MNMENKDWAVEEKRKAYEEYVANNIDQDEFHIRLNLIEECI